MSSDGNIRAIGDSDGDGVVLVDQGCSLLNGQYDNFVNGDDFLEFLPDKLVLLDDRRIKYLTDILSEVFSSGIDLELNDLPF